MSDGLVSYWEEIESLLGLVQAAPPPLSQPAVREVIAVEGPRAPAATPVAAQTQTEPQKVETSRWRADLPLDLFALEFGEAER